MEDYKNIFEKKFDEMLESLKALVAIPSVASEAEGEAPFGKNVEAALDFMLKKAEADGFVTVNTDGFGGHIDFPGKTGEIVALVNHLDVVPAGAPENWSSPPFSMEIRDGKVYGRGVLDNKGPLLLCYYAMLALKDAGFVPEKTIRLILGCDEETKWQGMDYYMEHVQADIVSGFSADADFPVIHAEKGVTWYKIHVPIGKSIGSNDMSLKAGETVKVRADSLNDNRILPHLISIKGGSVMNAVPDMARAEISTGGCSDETLAPLYGAAEKFEKYGAELVENGDMVTLMMPGVTAHAAWPEGGKNAISRICDVLSKVEFDDPAVNDFFAFYEDHIGYELHGEHMGCGLYDEPSGKLTFNVSTIESRIGEIVLGIDVRYPVTFTRQSVNGGVSAVLYFAGYKLEPIKHQEPLYKSPEDPLVRTLMEVYKKNTGDKEAKPIAIGGGTYARAVRNTVAFGPVMPGKADMCHQPDEFMEIEQMHMAGHIFADAIYELAK